LTDYPHQRHLQTAQLRSAFAHNYDGRAKLDAAGAERFPIK
jgi:hypothetical protein